MWSCGSSDFVFSEGVSYTDFGKRLIGDFKDRLPLEYQELSKEIYCVLLNSLVVPAVYYKKGTNILTDNAVLTVELNRVIDEIQLLLDNFINEEGRNLDEIFIDNGIEIRVPLDLMEDASFFRYEQKEDGTMSIIIDNINKIRNR